MRFINSALLWVRSILLTFFFILYTLICSVVCILQNLLLNNPQADEFFMRYMWSYVFFWMAGVKLEKRGNEHPELGGGIYTFSHTSHMDILAMYALLRPMPRFGAKIELFKIPVFGWAMRRVGTLPIARGQREEVLRVYQMSIPRLEQGERFALAPEGTRQEGRALGRFKTGPFIFAIQAQKPIFPVVLSGAMEVQPKSSYLIQRDQWRGHIILEIGEPIPTAGMTMDDMPRLQEQTRQAMDKILKQHNEERGLVSTSVSN